MTTSSVAVFIDVENIHYSTLNNYSETPDWGKMVEKCKEYGRISSIQAFGDWVNFSKEIPEIQRCGIQPVYVPLSQDGKSSLDCYLTVSAMKLFFQNDTVDTLILASGDRDYIPLITELKSLGKQVIIVAVPGTLSQDLTTIVDEVIEYEPSKYIDTDAENSIATASYGDFVTETIRDLEQHSISDRWVNLASIGLALKKRDSGFSHKLYGYKKLAEMLDDIDEVEIKYDNFEKTVALARTNLSTGHQALKREYKGTIQNLKEGYGFITPDDGGENIFFHYSQLLDVEFYQLNTGDKVSYGLYNTERGLNAENIKIQP